MKTLALAGALLLLTATTVHAHRLDEYLQATTIALDKKQVQVQMHLTPGVAVFPAVLARMDADADGTLSASEQRTYAEQVRGDISLTVDGAQARLQLTAWKFAPIKEMREGRGDITLDFEADVPRGGPRRKLVFENRHQSKIAVYLVNCLVPSDPDIEVTTQNRSDEQSHYQLEYMQGGGLLFGLPNAGGGWKAAALLLLAPFAFLRRPHGGAARQVKTTK